MTIAELKGMNLYQSVGSAVTYIRRYDMSTLLGLLSEKDDDGGTGKQTKKVVKKTQPQQAVKKEKLTTDHEKFNRLVKWLKDGGDINKIEAAYYVSDDVKQELLKRSNNE